MSAKNPTDPDETPMSRARLASGPTSAEVRLARQKAALKANMARRKAQARDRVWDRAGETGQAGQTGSSDTETGNKDKE